MAKVGIEPKSLADFQKSISAFAQEVKGDVKMIALEQIRLMCRDAMTFTPPMPAGGGRGLTKAAYKAGAGKLAKDVKRIFVAQDDTAKSKNVLLRQVINAVKGNDRQTFFELSTGLNQSKVRGLSPVMRKIMEDTDWERAYKKAQNYLSKANINGTYRPMAGMATDLRSIHDKYKGKVGGRWPKNAPIGGPQYFVQSMTDLQAYIATRQLKVGHVKAGWATCLQQLPLPMRKNGKPFNFGAYDAPWVDRNKAGLGYTYFGNRGSSVSAIATNFIGNINKVSDEAGTVNIVYGNRVKQLDATVSARIRDAVARANRR